MIEYEEHLQQTVRAGKRKQDSLIPQKYRYAMAFDNLAEDNTHIVAIVLFGFRLQSSSNLSLLPRCNQYLLAKVMSFQFYGSIRG